MNKNRTSSFLIDRKQATCPPVPESITRTSAYRLGAIALLACSLLLGTGLTGCGSDSKTFSPNASNAVVTTPSSVDFGDVKIGSGATQTISIKNPGTSAIEISELSSSSTAFTVTSTSLPTTLSAGQTLDVKVRYDAKSTADSSGTLNVTTTSLSTRGSRSSSTTKLHGKGSNSGTPSLSSLSCSSSSMSSAGPDNCSVYLNGAAPSTGLAVDLVSSSAAVSVPASVSVPSGATTASFTAAVSAVTTAQTVTLTATQGSTSKTAAIKLSGSSPAVGTPSLSLSTTSIAFGSVSVGTAVTKSVTLTSNGSATVSIGADSISGTGFSVSGGTFPVTLNPGQSLVLSVQFDPTASGSIAGQLAISSNAPAATVTLTGTGSTVTPTVAALSCGSTSITGALSDSCTVTLSGSAPSGGLSVALASSSGSVTVPASVSVPATAVSATFAANVAAVTTATSASLTASSGSTSKTLGLQLNAATAALSVNAGSISFGAVVVNHATTQTVSLTSSGTAAVTVNSISVSGNGFSASAVTLPAKLSPGQTLNLTLTFDPTTTGNTSGQLTISSTSSTNSTISIGLSGTGNPHQVDLAWNSPSSSGMAITGYKVYRAISGSGGFASLSSSIGQTSFTDIGVQSATKYDYYVTSIDSSGVESSPSNTTTVAIP